MSLCSRFKLFKLTNDDSDCGISLIALWLKSNSIIIILNIVIVLTALPRFLSNDSDDSGLISITSLKHKDRLRSDGNRRNISTLIWVIMIMMISMTSIKMMYSKISDDDTTLIYCNQLDQDQHYH